MDEKSAKQADYVRHYVGLPYFSLNGLDLRVFSMMGDRVASVIHTLIPPEGTLDEMFLKRALAAVCASIEHQQTIENEPDRTPTATLQLLKKLSARVVTEEQRTRVDAAILRVEAHARKADK